MVLDLCVSDLHTRKEFVLTKRQILEGCATIAVGILAFFGMSFFGRASFTFSNLWE